MPPAIVTSTTRNGYERCPSGSLTINWAHPSSRGIVAAWPFGGGLFGGFNVRNPSVYKLTLNGAPPHRSTAPGGYATNYNGSNQDSELASTAVLTAVPVTLEAWFNPTSATTQQVLVGITDGDNGGAWFTVELDGHIGGDPISASRNQTTIGERFAYSTNGYFLNAWQHAIAVFPTSTLMWSQLRGSGYGSETTAVVPNGLNRTMLGAFRVSSTYYSPFVGDLNCAIIRNVAVSVSEARERADPALRYAFLHQLGRTAYSFKSVTGIAFDAASNSGVQTAQSTYSWSHTCTGADRYLAVDVSLLSAGSTVTGITYNGVALSLISGASGSTVTSFGRIECWGLAAPASGSNTIAVTLSGSITSVGTAVSYAGVHQTSPTEAGNFAQATNVGAADATVSITSVADQCWIHAAIATDDAAITAGQTSRNNVSGGAANSGADEDFGPQAAGAKSMTYTGVAALATWAIAGYAIRPTTASGLAVFTKLVGSGGMAGFGSALVGPGGMAG